MTAALLLALVMQAGPVERALDERRFEEALALADEAPGALARARARAEVFYRARDPAGALREARAGLAQAPQDPALLFRALGAALWLADGARALALAQQLEAALEAARLGPDERRAWDEACAPLFASARELVRAEDARERAVSRARTTALGMLGLCAAAFGALLARTPRP